MFSVNVSHPNKIPMTENLMTLSLYHSAVMAIIKSMCIHEYDINAFQDPLDLLPNF